MCVPNGPKFLVSTDGKHRGGVPSAGTPPLDRPHHLPTTTAANGGVVVVGPPPPPLAPTPSSSHGTPPAKQSGGDAVVSRAGLAVLVLLAVQNCVKNLVMRAAVRGNAQFLYAAAVIGTESLKCTLSCAYVCATGGSPASIFRYLRAEWRKMVLLTVPAAIYNFQQTLEYVALAHLNAAVFSVLVQCKLLSTAVFAAALMGKQLRRAQVISLVLLTTGVMLAQLRAASGDAPPDETGATASDVSKLVGVAATFGIALCSGFAAVYTEKVIKAAARVQQARAEQQQQQQQQQPLLPSSVQHAQAATASAGATPASGAPAGGLAYTQIQLALTSLIIMGLWAAATDYESIRDLGLWHGFDVYAMIAVFNSAIGGLTVAAVLRFADAILKGYATAVSVMLTGIFSFLIFGTQLNTEYLLGMGNVITAVILYNAKDLDAFAW